MKSNIRLILAIFVLCGHEISNAQLSFWQQNSSEFDGGAVFAIAVDSQQNIYAGIGGGVLRSTDNGSSWTRLSTYSTTKCSAVSQSPSGSFSCSF